MREKASIWLCTALALLCVLCSGCGTSGGPASICDGQRPVTVIIPTVANLGGYVGPDLYNDAIRGEVRRMLGIVGKNPAEAGLLNIDMQLLDPMGDGPDGKWGDLPGSGSVHAAFQGQFMSFNVEYWDAACPGDKPDMRHISHEALHNVLIVWFNLGGHPDRFTLDGVAYTADQLLMSDARWPMRVAKGAWRIATPWVTRKAGSGFREVVNGELHTGGFGEGAE